MSKSIALVCLLIVGCVSFSFAQSKKEMKEDIVRLKEQVTYLTAENIVLDSTLNQAKSQINDLSLQIGMLMQELSTIDFRVHELLRENEALRGQISPSAQRKLKKRSQQAQQQPKAQ